MQWRAMEERRAADERRRGSCITQWKAEESIWRRGEEAASRSGEKMEEERRAADERGEEAASHGGEQRRGRYIGEESCR